MIFLLLSACDRLPENVVMTGVVGDTPYGGGGVVGGSTVDIADNALEPFDSQVADDKGAFTVTVPAGMPFFLTLSAEGYVSTAFSGTSGVYDFHAPEGYPWIASEAWLAALREEFVACPSVEAVGAVVAGEVRSNFPGVAYDKLPIERAGNARVVDADDIEYTSCYLDDEGVSLADGTTVGATGRFAVFGIPPGEIVVDVRFTEPDGVVPVQLYRFIAPEHGLVPLFPALVDVP